jgi:hypothetical protein
MGSVAIKELIELSFRVVVVRPNCYIVTQCYVAPPEHAADLSDFGAHARRSWRYFKAQQRLVHDPRKYCSSYSAGSCAAEAGGVSC